MARVSQRQTVEAWPRVTVLATKLHIPQPRRSLVTRQRLLTRLAEGLALPLVLVSAPAGFGKTTLVSEMVHRAESWPAAWLSLDDDDNDPARFLAYLISALDTLKPGIGAAARDLLESPQPPSWKAVLTALVNGLANLGNDFVLVLDDYHVLTEPAVHAALSYLIDHQPSQMHLVILSRADPPLSLARLRARGQILELRAADLRFTAEETTTFLNQAMKLGLSPADMAALEARTEGWIAGLQLAALCLATPDDAGPRPTTPGTQRRQDASSFIAAFGGSNRFILDYLVEEVLAHQPGRIQRFLLRTAILDQLCGPLCDAVMGDQPGEQTGQTMLESLEQLNLFITPLDHERCWYRYHHLFAEFLRDRLRQTESDLIPELHRRASEWYERHHFPNEAIGHALEAADWEQSSRLIEEAGQDVLMRSQVATLMGWLGALPADVVGRRPRLSMLFAWALLIAGRFELVEPHLANAARALGPGMDTTHGAGLQAEITVARALAAIYAGGDFSNALEMASQTLRDLPLVDPFLRGLVLWVSGLASYLGGDVASAGRAFDESLEIGETTGNSLVSQLATWTTGYQQAFQGHLKRAFAILERGLRLATAGADFDQLPPITCVVYQALGEIKREWNELDSAERYLGQAAILGEQLNSPEMIVDGQVSLARVRQANGDPAGALRALEPALAWIRSGKTSIWTARQVGLYQARLQVAQGDLRSGAQWAEDLSKARQTTPGGQPMFGILIDSLEDLTLARLFIAQHRYREAEDLLRAVLDRMVSSQWGCITVEALAVRALALDGQGNSGEAVGMLHASLLLAEPEGYARLYLDEGAPMAALLAELISQREVTTEPRDPAVLAYAAHLLAQFPVQRSAGGPAAPTRQAGALRTGMIAAPVETRGSASGSLEPLSEREREVLALVAAGLSTREIAARLVVTEGTVKRHVNNILGKLEAHSRTQAIARARALHIL